MMRPILLACLFATACGQPQGADGYRFEEKEYTRGSIEVSVVEHDSLADLRNAARRDGRADPDGLQAFTELETRRPACTIHIVDPSATYAPEWIGHELTHCIHGRWHGPRR